MAKTAGALAKHFARQKLTAGQFVVQSGCLSIYFGDSTASQATLPPSSHCQCGIAGLCRRHQGSHHRGRDNRPQDQDVSEKPEPDDISSAMAAKFAKERELRLFDRDQANRCFAISLLALQQAAQNTGN